MRKQIFQIELKTALTTNPHCLEKNSKTVESHSNFPGKVESMQESAVAIRPISMNTSQVARQVGAYPGFCSMKRAGLFLLPPGRDASPSQGYPQH